MLLSMLLTTFMTAILSVHSSNFISSTSAMPQLAQQTSAAASVTQKTFESAALLNFLLTTNVIAVIRHGDKTKGG
jgi:hypothetical protein